jgi:hypothetical protein
MLTGGIALNRTIVMSQVDLSVIRSYAAAAVQGLIAATWHDAASCERIALDAFDIAERMAAEEQT